LAQDLRETDADAVVDTSYFRDKAALEVAPGSVRSVLAALREKGFRALMSVHGVDYWPHEPRLGVHYELLDMHEVDRMTVKVRVPLAEPNVPSVVAEWPTADHQEREVYDMFGVIFDGHPDLRRILMPEDYEGFPQRRDFPMGGEPILFTHNEPTNPGWWQ
jgi:NADH-quinone oxidoreductase subunit C